MCSTNNFSLLFQLLGYLGSKGCCILWLVVFSPLFCLVKILQNWSCVSDKSLDAAEDEFNVEIASSCQLEKLTDLLRWVTVFWPYLYHVPIERLAIWPVLKSSKMNLYLRSLNTYLVVQIEANDFFCCFSGNLLFN